MHVKVEAGAEDVLAQKAVFTGLLNGDLKALNSDGILSTDIYIALVCADGVGGNGHSFDNAMRVALEDGAIHERAGVALVSVAGYILFAGGAHGELPLKTGGESAAATAAQTGIKDGLNNVFTAHFGQDLCKGLVAVKSDVLIDVLGIDNAAVSKNYALLLLIETDLVEGLDFGRALFLGSVIKKAGNDAALNEVLVNDLINVFNLYMAVERAFGIYDNNGAGSAKAEAAGANEFNFLFKAFFGEQRLKAIEKLARTGRSTTGTAADQNCGTEQLHNAYLLK